MNRPPLFHPAPPLAALAIVLIFLFSGVVLAAAQEIAPAAETAFPTRDYLTGNWSGVRDRLHHSGVRVGLNYSTETMFNVAGGEKQGGTYADNIDLALLFDLAKLTGIPRTTFLVKMSQRDGDSVSARFIAPSQDGNTFPVQELYGGQTFKLVNVQFNTRPASAMALIIIPFQAVMTLSSSPGGTRFARAA